MKKLSEHLGTFCSRYFEAYPSLHFLVNKALSDGGFSIEKCKNPQGLKGLAKRAFIKQIDGAVIKYGLTQENVILGYFPGGELNELYRVDLQNAQSEFVRWFSKEINK